MSLVLVERFFEFADNAISLKHALPDGIDPAELESCLVSQCAVLLYAHMEQCFRGLLEKRFGKCDDVLVRTFALSVKEEKTGKLKVEAIKGTLKRFGSDCRDGFDSLLRTIGCDVSWDSVVAIRNSFAHSGQPPTCSFRDLKTYFEDVKKFLGVISVAISLSEADTMDISGLIILPVRK